MKSYKISWSVYLNQSDIDKYRINRKVSNGITDEEIAEVIAWSIIEESDIAPEIDIENNEQ